MIRSPKSSRSRSRVRSPQRTVRTRPNRVSISWRTWSKRKRVERRLEDRGGVEVGPLPGGPPTGSVSWNELTARTTTPGVAASAATAPSSDRAAVAEVAAQTDQREWTVMRRDPLLRIRGFELADPLDGLEQPRGLDGQGGADVAVGGPAEAEPGRGHDVGLVEQPGAELGRGVALGAGDPDVEGRLGASGRPSRSRACAETNASRRSLYRARIGGVSVSYSSSAVLAANWMAVKMPESVFAFTWPRAAIIGAPPIAKPTRQPVMLKVFERLWNSIATSLAPGTCRMLGGGLLEVHLVVGGVLGDHEVVRLGQLDDLLEEGQVGRRRRSGCSGS